MHSLKDSLSKLLTDFSQYMLLFFIGLTLHGFFWVLFFFFLASCRVIIKNFL